MSPDELRKFMERILAFTRDAAVTYSESQLSAPRFAANRMISHVETSDASVSIEVRLGKKRGSASTNDFSEEGLRKMVAAAETFAKLSPDDEELMPRLGSQDYPRIEAYVAGKQGLDGFASVIARARKADCQSAGYFPVERTRFAHLNSEGLWFERRASNATCNLTVRTPDGTGAGWAEADHRDASKIDVGALGERALEKALSSRKPQPLDPGKYAVILEPAAAAEFVRLLAWSLDRRAADEGRSFWSGKSGRVLGENFTMKTQIDHPDLLGSPFGEDGLPRQDRTWFEGGELKQLASSRYWASKKGVEPTGGAGDLVVSGGEKTLEQLVEESDRAVLVTHFWYIRGVDPMEILYTGLTRDGLFWIEKGRIAKPLVNFRWNESPARVFKNIDALSRPCKVGEMMVPAMRIRDFTFSSIAPAV